MNNPYLDLLEKHNITPNFWISDEYFKKARFNTMIGEDDNSITVWDDNQLVFPAIDKNGKFLRGVNPIWADFDGYKDEWKEPKFLDYNYIYNPFNFNNMEGNKWAVFRKNVRKFPERINHMIAYSSYRAYDTLCKGSFEKELVELAEDWLKKIDFVHDEKTFLKYLFEGENRGILYDSMGKIYGINIWDENYEFVNFRYCICGKHEFISEYMRYCFYTDKEIQYKNKFVNDGGILDNPELARFKDKLNPILKLKIYSWK